MSGLRNARAIADLSAGTILATVEIAVPVERVFEALTDPRELMAWWGSPETYQAHTWESDFRVGGRWRAAGTSSDGKPYAVEGEFLEIAPPHRLVQTWRHDWEVNQSVTRVTYTLAPMAGGTRLTVHHEGFGDRTESCEAHSHGWTRVLQWLAAHVDTHP